MGFWEWLTGNPPVDPQGGEAPQEPVMQTADMYCRNCGRSEFYPTSDGKYQLVCSEAGNIGEPVDYPESIDLDSNAKYGGPCHGVSYINRY
ncbi:MAG: hypothetical protein IJS47_05400 [Clostridia bacterium]|nr:hypothetical protein [Clostridia bacterium]